MRALLLIALLSACTGDTTDTDTEADSDTEVDTEIDTDAAPLDGFGELSGDCGPLNEADILSDGPSLFQGAIDLPTGFDDALLSDGGQDMVDGGNLNQSSLYSEVFSYEVLYRCEGAALLLTEGEVTYDNPDGKKTDLVVDVDGYRVGVSVVRAVGWPRTDPWGVEIAQPLIERKLSDILLSSDNVADSDAWEKQILHVIAYSPEHANSVATAWTSIDDATRADTILWITATNGEDGFIYGD